MALPPGLSVLSSPHPSFISLYPIHLLSPVGLLARDSISQRRNEGHDSCLCSQLPHFINQTLGHGVGVANSKGGEEGAGRKPEASSG